MKKRIEDQARKIARLTSERHLDLNRLMREHFCGETSKPKKNAKGKKKR